MQKVPTWKWILLAAILLIGLYYLVPSFMWYRLPPEIRNSPTPETEQIVSLRSQMAEIKSATDETSLTDMRRLERELQDEKDSLFELRKKSIPLGLDLAGGMHVVLEVEDATVEETTGGPMEQRQPLLDQTLTIYRARIDKLGLTEPIVEKQPPNRILIQIPGIRNPEDVLKVLRAQAQLEFRLAASRDVMTRTVDAVFGDNPTLRERIAFMYPSVRIAERDIESASMTLTEKRLDIPPDYSFIWGPIEVQAETGDRYRNLYLLEDRIQMAGDTLTKAYVTYQTSVVTQPIVSLEFDRQGTAQFARVTSEHVNENLAIVLDGLVYSAPNINEPIRQGRAVISGSFTTQEAANLAVVLEAGALKTSVRIVENRTIGPSLGMDSIQQGLKASIWGFIAVIIFMQFYYAISGTFAIIALLMNIFLLMAAMGMFHATLTLPGIAGIVLTIGMAVDANVLVFERIREEIAGRTAGLASAAIERGYGRALSAIVDSNLTTLLTAMVLMNFGTGPIKGFAITLSTGLVISLFTAVFVVRMFQDTITAGKKYDSISVGRVWLFKNLNLNFMKMGPVCVAGSIIVIVVGLGFAAANWENMKGLELTGGSMVRLSFAKATDIEQLRSQLNNDLLLENYQLQEIGTSSQEFIIRLKRGTVIPEGQEVIQILPATSIEATRKTGEGVIYTRPNEPEVDLANYVTEGLDKLNQDTKVTLSSVESFAASFGREMSRKGLTIVVFSWCFILLYLAFRFQWVYGVAAVIALVHDVLICVAALGISNALGYYREINLSVIAAFLTVIGYSVNDTIIVFDRIRENRRGGSESLLELINRSISQTFSRTIITSLTTLVVVLSLFLFGGSVINDFSFILLIGFMVGTYSSIYVASYFLFLWQGRKQTLRAKH